MKRIISHLSAILALILIYACEHKELCFEHPHLVPVRIEANWDRYCEYPIGMTAYLFPQDNSAPIVVKSQNPDYVSLRLPVNTYDIIVINDHEEDFGGLKFRNTSSFSRAEAYVYNVLVQKMKMKNSSEEPVVADPERLGTAIIRDFKVTEEMLSRYWYQRDNGLPIEDNVLTVHPENVIYMVDVKIHVHGIQYIRTVAGSLTGMSEGHIISTGERTSNKVTHLLTNWQTVSTSDTDPNEGYLHATCFSIGLPDNHMAEASENLLDISVLLVDNETRMDFVYRVGNRFREERPKCTPILYLEFGKTDIDDPDPDDPDPDDPDPDDPDPDDPDPDDPDPDDPDPDDPDPDDPDPDDPDPDDPGYDDPDDPIIFPEVKPEGSFDGGVTIDPTFDGDHSIELKSRAIQQLIKHKINKQPFINLKQTPK